MTNFVGLVAGFGWHVQDLRRAAELLNVQFRPVPFPSLTSRLGGKITDLRAKDCSLTQCDGVVVRMMPPGTLEQVVFRMDALHRLAAHGIPILNPPAAVEAAVDKYLASAKIEAAALSVPKTWVGESAEEALEAFQSLNRDVVVKPLFGSEGRGLVRVSDMEVAWRVFRTLERIGAVLYLQEFVPNEGHDLRVFVLGSRVLGAIRRHAPSGDWRTNVSLGGRAEAFRPEPAIEELAILAARAVGARMAGVDLLPDRQSNLFVIEVNAVPGWRALSQATGIDVAAEILADLRDARR